MSIGTNRRAILSRWKARSVALAASRATFFLIGASYCQTESDVDTEYRGGYSVDRWVQSVISHSRELASSSTSSHLHDPVIPRDFSPLRFRSPARDDIAPIFPSGG